MEIRPRQFFSEPGGWKTARGLIAASLLAFGLSMANWLRYGEWTGVLVVGTAIGIAGIAELLPKDRRPTASVTRVTAVGILVVHLVATFL